MQSRLTWRGMLWRGTCTRTVDSHSRAGRISKDSCSLLVRQGGNPLIAILSPASSGDGKGILPTI